MKITVAMAVLLVVTSGCAADSQVRTSEAQAQADALNLLKARREMGDVVGGYAAGLKDYLPGQLVSIDGSDPRPLAAGIVHGTIREVQPHGAYAVATLPNGEEDPDGETLAFSDSDADWRMVAVTVDIEEAWGQDVPHSGQVGFVLPVGSDPDAFMRGVESFGEVVVILSGSYSEDASLYRVAESDAAIGLVDEVGALSFPALGTDARAFVRDAGTVEAIADKAYEEQPLIVVKDFAVVSR